MTTYYHVVSDRWQPGQPLLCWHEQVARGLVTDADWHWPEAPVGFDGDRISLHRTLAEATEYRDNLERDYDVACGSRILAVEIDEDEVEVLTNSEGYPCIRCEIPAARLRVVEFAA